MCRTSAGAAQAADPAALGLAARAEALHLEVGAGLRRHRTRHAVVPRTAAGGAGRTREGQEETC